MNYQKVFKYSFSNNNNLDNFYTNSTNEKAFNYLLNTKSKKILLIGPKKSGKSFLGNLWLKQNKAKLYNNNFYEIINNKYNVLIDDFNLHKNEEEIFHIINHCHSSNTSILVISNKEIRDLNLQIEDLASRIRAFNYIVIHQPDDDMLLNILTKLFVDKQFIINSNDIFEFIIRRANRSYEEIINIVNKLDKLSLEKKRQLTIPLIKEIL